MKKSRLAFLIIGIAILAFFVLMALFPQLFSPLDRKQSFGAWLPPSADHILGTNSLGYDIFAELVYGASVTLTVAITASLLSLVFGVLVGMLATVKGLVGVLFNGLINVFVLLPKLIILIVLSSFLGSSTTNLIILIACFSWVGTARAVRAKVVHIYAQPYIEACKIYGYSRGHIALKHVLPNLYDVISSRFLASMTSCIMMESTLSFLGFGDLYYPTWGVMINLARLRGAVLLGAYQYLLAPCVCIMLVSLSFYFVGIYMEEKHSTINGVK